MMINKVVRSILLFCILTTWILGNAHAVREQCSECGFLYEHLYIQEHIKAIHTRELPHDCKQCGQCYSSVRGLSKHSTKGCLGKSVCCKQDWRTVSVDFRDGEYGCSECPKRFRCEENRDAHQKVHQERYECADCGRYFSTQAFLAQHQGMIATGSTLLSSSSAPDRDEHVGHGFDMNAVQQDFSSPIPDEDPEDPFGLGRTNYDELQLEAFINNCCMRGNEDFGSGEFFFWRPSDDMEDM